FRPGLRSHADHVAVRILDVHLKRPRIVCRWKTDGHSASFVFLVHLFGVFHTDPDPRSAAALIAPAQVDSGSVARHVREVIVAPTRLLKPQGIYVKLQAGLHVLYTKDRRAIFKTN